MTTCTRIGIVEWARRIGAAHATELGLADSFGGAVAGASSTAAKVALARTARRHGWYAQLWDGVMPLLHDHDDARLDAVTKADTLSDTLAGGGTTLRDDPQGARAAAVERLLGQYRAWLGDTTPIAEAPITWVLEVILADDARAPERETL
ncbi:MAG TPA: hypothetical protein VEP49_20730 [Acidimicrobiia bacterium]|nr:hypothetical protein [Acidimicrobiia bacterium]